MGFAVGAAWIVLGLATGWFGTHPPLSLAIGFVGGLLSTAVIGPVLEGIAWKRS